MLELRPVSDAFTLKIKSTVIVIISHIQGHKKGKDDERSRVRKMSTSRERRKPGAARRGSKGSSGMKGMGKSGPHGSRIWPKERARVWSLLMEIRGPSSPSWGH